MKCNGKKITAVIMSLAMGAAFMTGCSGAGNTTAQKAGNGKSVVTVWAGGSDNVRVQFEKQIETFNASQDKYEAVAEFQGNWYDNFAKFKATPKEDLPDLYQIVVECMGWLAESDMIIPVQEFIDRDNFDISSMQENIRNLYTLDGFIACP